MKSRVVLVILAGLSLALLALTQTSNPDELTRPGRSQPRASQRTKPAAPGAETAPLAADNQELEAMRADLAKMRALLTQMRNNLAFVQTTDTPLRHEFDLNNEMWQMMLNDMDRRVQKLQSRSAKP